MTFQSFTGPEYLKIDIASNYGLDNIPWNDRIRWFDDNINKAEELVAQAKEPALFYAGLKAWRQVEAGQPIGYMICLDATSSGLQLLAALTGDSRAANLCNVVDTGNREDAYTNIYNSMLVKVGDTAKIDRAKTKEAIMTALYSSKAVPKKVFGEGKLLDTFYETMQQEAPGCWELNEAMIGMWQCQSLSHDWILPDNFNVIIKVMGDVKETVHFLNKPYDVFYKENQPMKEGRSLGANTIHSIDGMIVREITRRCDYDPERIASVRKLITIGNGTNTKTENDKMVKTLWDHYKHSGYLSARILDYMTADNVGLVNSIDIINLIDSMPKKPFKVISIHDAFRCLPHYGNDLRQQYNLQLELIAKSELLSYVISQILGRKIKLNKLDPYLWKTITHANYSLS